jgi:hypothetical protein
MKRWKWFLYWSLTGKAHPEHIEYHRPTHRHDFKMTFPYEDRPFDWVLRCECGETAYDLGDALRRMR